MKNKIVWCFKNGLKLIVFLGFMVLVYSGVLYIFKNVSRELSQGILDYLKVIIWPTVILIIVFLFKSNIAQLIERMDEWDIPFLGKGKAHKGVLAQQEKIKTDVITAGNEGKDFKTILDAKEKEIRAIKDNTQQLVDKLTRAQIELDFEKIYNSIFSSQIDLLLKINAFSKVEFAYILDHYAKVQKSAVPLLNNWTVFQYIQFLINNQLIEYRTDIATASITPKGKAFLLYLAFMNYKKYGI